MSTANPVLVQCPHCSSDVPVPRLRPGETDVRVRVRCRVCETLLAIHRPARSPVDDEETGELRGEFVLPGYETLGMLGRGGMGVVYSAVRLLDKQLIAVKVLPPECARYPELIRRFDQEGTMMASLSHPNIVPVLDRGQIGKHSYIVMDYIPGCNLKHRIHRAAPLAIDEVVAIASPVSEAIQACHDVGLVHRDLKPANILLSQLGQVLVTDFGIANLIQLLGHQTDHGVMIGTPQYVAPEQLRDGSKVDTRADQYSLAVIIYEMLTGMLPLGVFEQASKTCPALTPEAEEALMKALARDPQKRFATTREFMRAFRRGLNLPEDRTLPEILIRAAASSSSSYIQSDDMPGQAAAVHVKVLNDDWAKTYEAFTEPTPLQPPDGDRMAPPTKSAATNTSAAEPTATLPEVAAPDEPRRAESARGARASGAATEAPAAPLPADDPSSDASTGDGLAAATAGHESRFAPQSPMLNVLAAVIVVLTVILIGLIVRFAINPAGVP